MSGSAWARGDVVFGDGVLQAVHAHLCSCYPDEGCGYISGPAGEPWADRFVPMPNEQNRYHARSPEDYPRTARTAYLMNPLEFEQHYEQALQAGSPIKVIVHSHADHDAYFSAEDRAFAVLNGSPTRDCSYLVVSIGAAAVAQDKLFAWDPELGAYRETLIQSEEAPVR